MVVYGGRFQSMSGDMWALNLTRLRLEFADAGDGCDVEVAITYRIPRAIADIVEGPRAQRFIRSLLKRTLDAFAVGMEKERAGD